MARSFNLLNTIKDLGPCESDEDCPPNLYCINFDCWTIPERPLGHLQGRHKNERSFAVERAASLFADSNDNPLSSLTPPPSGQQCSFYMLEFRRSALP